MENQIPKTKEEYFDYYNLEGDTLATRFRTLNKPGAYIIRITDTEGNMIDCGCLATVDDADGNGVIDTVTNVMGQSTPLEIEGAFSGR